MPWSKHSPWSAVKATAAEGGPSGCPRVEQPADPLVRERDLAVVERERAPERLPRELAARAPGQLGEAAPGHLGQGFGGRPSVGVAREEIRGRRVRHVRIEQVDPEEKGLAGGGRLAHPADRPARHLVRGPGRARAAPPAPRTPGRRPTRRPAGARPRTPRCGSRRRQRPPPPRAPARRARPGCSRRRAARGYRPVIIEKCDGRVSGIGQAALSNTTPWAASASMRGLAPGRRRSSRGGRRAACRS